MENQNVTTNPQGGDLSELKKMFSDFAKKSQAQSTRRKSREEILSKYFVPRNNKETFRILPPKPGKKHIEEAFFHVVPTTTSGGKKKHGTIIYCPAHNDPKVPKMVNGQPALDTNGQPVMIPAPCPLCAKAKKILSQQNPALKGKKKETLNADELKIFEKNKEIFIEANKWEAKKFYIVRGIDKGEMKDGVKFWRFKHNFKNQGTLDKLLPILEQYMSTQQADFSHPDNGTDLNILMTDSVFNNHTYKTISAIMFNGKSKLHDDPVVVKTWLEDDITWRDVYPPKKAPGITNYEFLEMVANGTNPYWDESDASNKHWVFPGRPDLEQAANTRTRNLDADGDEEFEQASDLIDEEYPRVTINNITADNVGTYKDDAVDMSQASVTTSSQPAMTQSEPEPESSSEENYDDLPF